MARDNVTIDMSNGFLDDLLSNSNNKSENLTDENTRLCPLCRSPVRLFYINYNEKFLMCENTECDYPFGYEELQFVKEDLDEASEEGARPEGCESPAHSLSQSSAITGSWSDIDKIRTACESEDTQSERSFITKEHHKRLTEEDKKMMHNINQIMKLNKEINSLDESSQENLRIKNEKWIKNLHTLQELSGVQLLKPEEMDMAKREHPNIGLGELKIDITPATETSLSTINIEVCNVQENNDRSEEQAIVYQIVDENN